jgi:hypothetical protein
MTILAAPLQANGMTARQLRQMVELAGGDAGFDEGGDVVEHLGGQTARDAHFFDFLRGLARYSHASRPVPR